MKVLHSADIHLTEEGDDRWKALVSLVDVSETQGADYFVISGDLFDKNVKAETLRPTLRNIFSKTSSKIFILPGNHDYKSFGKGKHYGDNVIVLGEYEDDNIRFIGLPFDKDADEAWMTRKLQALRNKFKDDKPNILVYHGELLDSFYNRGDMGDEGERRYMPVHLSDFSDLGLDYVLAGHFHTKFYINRCEDGCFFVYPGSPASVTTREIGKRKANLFEVGSEPKPYELDTLYYSPCNIELNYDDEKAPKEKVESALSEIADKNCRVLVTISGFIKEDETKTIKALKRACSGKDTILLEPSVRDIRMVIEDDIFQDFERELEKKTYSEDEKNRLRKLVIRAFTEVKS